MDLNDFNKASEDRYEKIHEEIQNTSMEEGQIDTEEEITDYLSPLAKEGNSSPETHFKGFTRNQMNKMLFSPFEEGCPVQLNHLTEEQQEQIPIMRQVIQLMNTLAEKEIKLTASGSIPTKIIEEVYQQGKHSKWADQYKRKTEDVCLDVMIVRTMLEGAGMIKKRKGKLSLTAKGKKLLKDHNELLRAFFIYLFKDYNTTWLDNSEDIDSGQIGRVYSLWLLHHYGQSWCNTEIIAEDYYRAFGFIGITRIYTYRIFTALFTLMGLCEIRHTLNKEKYGEYADMFPLTEVIMNPIVEMIFSFEEPAKK